jgi:hypothetical protein
VDDTDAAAAMTFFFATYSKSFVSILNCSICNMSKCRTSRLLVHLFLQSSFFVDGVLNMGGSDEGEGGGTSNDAAP